MINMSFYNGTLNREVAKKLISETNKDIYLICGYLWKGASKNKTNKDNAYSIIEKADLLDIREKENEIILQTYSANDMW